MAASFCMDDSVTKLKQINGWVLEFVCKRVWQELKETHQVKLTSVDYVQGVLGEDFDKTPHHTCLIHLLLVMCKLMDGEKYDTRYGDEYGPTVLEQVASSFSCLIGHRMILDCENIVCKSNEYKTLIMKQAVFVCCRDGNFEMAKEVFTRQWNDVDESALEAKKEVLEVLMSEDAQHETLMSDSYETFLDEMITFLDEIFRRLPEPFLFKLARSYDPVVMGTGDVSYSVESSYFKVANKQGHKSPTSLSPQAAASLSEKLHRCRMQTMQELAGFEKDSPGKKSQSNSKRRNSSQDDTCMQDENELHNGVNTEVRSRKTPTKSRTKDLPVVVKKVKQDERKLKETTNKSRKTPTKSRTKDLSVVLKTAKEDRKKLKDATNNYADHFPLTPRFEDEMEDQSSRQKNKGASSSVISQEFRYKKNRNRSNRHDHSSEPESDVSDMDIDEDGRPPHLKQIQGQNRIKPHLRFNPKCNRTPEGTIPRSNWTEDEEEAFYLEVMQHGVGNWKLIQDSLNTTRTNVALKDKWRQLNRSGKLYDLIKKHGKVKK
ncbi:telomeric repeat-binding factor 1-like [Gigantopelta aegis]|uniref:telomeric repeat-binding factor 1-like n=1 Tax=Gigantopelta aegis TaxID=1735272 RepID=UPI001B88A6C5|nr:telomeric repeat-binding factor 1-like [Gigantopelta aegis]